MPPSYNKMPQVVQNGNVPYFPPPPTSAALAKHRSRSKSSSSSTKSNQPSHLNARPSALHRSRTYLLPCLLILSFAIFVLAVIYGYCVANPHTPLAPQHVSSRSTAQLGSSLLSRNKRSPISYDSIHPASNANATTSPTSSRSGYGSDEKPSAGLIFYLLTSPTLLLGLLSTELILHYSCPLNLTSRRAHILLLSSQSVSLVGLIISSTFWTSCELPAPQSTALERLCPAQVRGHFMYGIHELSIAKAAIAWVTVAGMLWHTMSLLRSSKASRLCCAAQREGQKQVQVQEVVIEMEEGLLRDGRSCQPARKRDRVVKFLS